MGLLFGGEDTTLNYEQSKPYQRVVHKAAALQLTKIFKLHYNLQLNEQKRLLHGTEEETHLIKRNTFSKSKNDPKNKKESQQKKNYSVFLGLEKFINQVPEKIKSRLGLHIEYCRWMLEVEPKKPFSGLINVKSVKNHFSWIPILNRHKINLSCDSEPKSKLPVKVLSCPAMPAVGFGDYLSPQSLFKKKNHQKNKFEEDEVWESDGFVFETVSQHSRFISMLQNFPKRRGSKFEGNIPIFVDKNTKILYKGLYKNKESYMNPSFSFKKECLEEFKKNNQIKKVLSTFFFVRTKLSKVTFLKKNFF